MGQEPVLEVAKGTLRHVDLMQGRKAYPSQVRPDPTSARWLSSTNYTGACCQDLLHWPAKESHTSEDGSDTASAKTSIWRAPLPHSPRGFLPASVS